MPYADNGLKLACVLSTGSPLPVALNALAHATAGLVARLPKGAVEFLDYEFADGGATNVIARNPAIVLRARNAGQVRRAWVEARSAGLPCNAFATSMIGASADEQLARTRSTLSADAELVALVIFGAAGGVDAVTRRFSLFRDSTPAKEN